MDRRSSTIVVLGLLLLGIAVCLKQTVEFYDSLGAGLANAFLTAEISIAAVIIASGLLLVWRRFSKRPGFNRPKGLVSLAHLRRLLADVWS